MKVENQKVVTLTYDLYVPGDNPGDKEELMECAKAEHPLIYCHGEGMMLPAFEAAMLGKENGEEFDFVIPTAEAYGEYDNDGVLTLEKKMFTNEEGEFDTERVRVGAVVPMRTVDGQVVNAMVAEITDKDVTIDLNHPLAGYDLHFVGKVIDIRDVTEGELKALHHKGCGGCHGGCHGSEDGESGCGNCGDGGCGGCH